MNLLIKIFATFFVLTNLSLSNEVNVFSSRHYDSDIQLYKKFTKKTGIIVNVISGKDAALQKRIIEEGLDSKEDLYINSEDGRIGSYNKKKMFQKNSFVSLKKTFFEIL